MKTTYKYITIVEIKKMPLTSLFEVFNNKSGGGLGIIKWYPIWRQYSFFPRPGTVFSQDCLRDITDFIKKEMDKRFTKSII